ncbi:MAG TPA: DUF169 domain-containing protein [Capsulimonadaceae bacterium]|nr:DUF169 domain-containing protein [Capsulimonadaceae bacterium]
MTNSSTITSILGTDISPIAIGLFSSPPEGVAKWQSGPVPAGCAFWREAQNGKSFYTTPEDHYNCAVGCYTHAIPLPQAREQELMQTVGFMVESNYISMDEIPGIPKLAASPQFIAYGPVDEAGFTPTMVVVAVAPSAAMLLYEATLAAGAGKPLMNVLGRPGCAIVPLTKELQGVSISLGCRGNRTFTGLPDSRLYLCIPGNKWDAVVEKLVEVDTANKKMGSYYESKLDQPLA